MKALNPIYKLLNLFSSKQKFYFLEENSFVSTYMNDGANIQLVKEFPLASLSQSLLSIQAEFPAIKNAEIHWFFENHPIEVIEKSNLNRDELLEYAKFKLQEVTHIPFQDSVYDIISNNNEEGSFFKKYLTAFVIQKSSFLFISNAFKQLKLKISSIDNSSLGLRDFFGSINGLNQSCAYIKIKKEKTYINIYHGSGLVISRSFEISNFLNDGNSAVVDKISLELQRIVDFLDRQHSIPQFSKICFSFPKDEKFTEIEDAITEYFSVEKITDEKIKTLIKNEFSKESFEVAALGLKGSFCKEQVNLIKRYNPIKKNEFVEDLKKTLAICSIIGLSLTLVGSFYYMQGRSLSNQNTQIKTDLERVQSLLSNLQNEVSTSSLNSQITQLEQEKNTILSISNNEYLKEELLTNLTNLTLEQNIFLLELSVDKDSFTIVGVSQQKETISLLLSSLVNKNIIPNNQVNNFIIEPFKDQPNLFSFKFTGIKGDNK